MRAILILLAGSFLSACSSSMIRTYAAGEAPTSSGLELVGEYSLPTSKIQVTISSPSAGSTAKDNAAASVNFNSAITINTAAVKTADKEKADTPKTINQSSVCADIRKAYNE